MTNNIDNKKVVLGVIGILALVLLVYSVSSCGCMRSSDNSESYTTEYSGNNKSFNNYRLYTDTPEQDYTYPRDRCKFCKGYNNYSFEAYEPSYKPCPHNCRQYGVSLCDQGTIM